MSTPALSWDAILNMANVEPELILDADMYLFFKNGMREGVSYMSKICSSLRKVWEREFLICPKYIVMSVKNI